MKKLVSLVTVFLILFLLIFSTKVFAKSLDTINVTTNKSTVHPGETVIVTIDFGTDLGSYTAYIAYDSNLLEYVSGTIDNINDTGDKVIALFVDNTGGSNPSSSVSVTFKAKDGITTSNPTEFSITADGLAAPDASEYDDITTPILKDIVVEPAYVDYSIALNYSGDIIVNEEKNIEIVVSSAMGKNYEHTRIIAEVVTPTNGTVQLLATDNGGLEHDIIQSGWGDAAGDSLGGENVSKKIAATGIFNTSGNYSITLKIIDRDNSDSVIASETFSITVKETSTTTNEETTDDTTETEEPATLPKTGNTVYATIILVMTILSFAYVLLERFTKK